MSEKLYDGLPIADYIFKIKSEHEKWGKLADEPVPRAAAVAIIQHFVHLNETVQEELLNCAGQALHTEEQLRGELTTANRRLAAANARETKLKNKITALKDELNEARANASD